MSDLEKNNKPSWYQAATRRDVVLRGTKVSLIVGTALVAINQGNLLLSGSYTSELFWKIPLTYLVPYLVSTYASAQSLLAEAGQAR